MPACCAGDDGASCGLNVDAAATLFAGLEGCIELGQASEAGDWNCEGLAMDTAAGAIDLRPCCRADSQTCGVDVSIRELGKTLGAELAEGAEFGCIDPLPFVQETPPENLPDFWKDGDAAASTAPACAAK